MLNEVCRFDCDGLFLLSRGGVNFIAVAVFYLGDENGFRMCFAIICRCAVRIGEFKQADIARAECQRWGIVEFALYAHVVSCLDDVFNTHFLTESYSYRVDTLSKCCTQGHGVTGEITVSIGRCPGDLFLLCSIPHLHGEKFIATFVTGSESLFHRFRIDEEFEGGARLTHSCYLVKLPMFEVYVANPGLYVTSLGFHSHKGTMHETYHISYGVHG